MTRNERTYARFYYKEFIRDYPHIWDDATAFHTWTRLLVAAESMWPAAPDLPRSVKTRDLAKLVSCGLIATDGRTYAVKGLHAERTARSNAARIAARSRWSNADGDAQQSTSTSTKTKAIRDGTPVENGRGPIRLVEPSR